MGPAPIERSAPTDRVPAPMNTALHAYEATMEAARQRLEGRSDLRRLMAKETEPRELHAFLIQWASFSVQLHDPAEQHLAEASRRCAELGQPKLALTLLHIAINAVDFYRMLADDTRSLAQLWNQRQLPHLDMTSLLTQPPAPAIRSCHEFHRQFVFGADPWAQLASVFEVQAILNAAAKRVLDQATRLLGEQALPGLRCVRNLADPTRASSLIDAMAEFLAANPGRHQVMVKAGLRTLDLYSEFLSECCVASSNLASWQARAI